MVTNPGTNPGAHDQDSNFDFKSDALAIKLSGHLSIKALKLK